MGARLKSRRECPPGGFIVSIAAINQSRPFWSFGEAVEWFTGVAVNNPTLKLPTNPDDIANYIDQQNALRCLGIPGADAYVLKGGPTHYQETKKATLLSPVIAVGEKIRQLSAGAKILVEWLGTGAHPVDPAEATRRASICATCPKNGLGDLTRWFTVFASEEIRQKVAVAQKLELKTQHDEQLGICDACLCPLKLKVHVPTENIVAHLTPAARAALDPRCWIPK